MDAATRSRADALRDVGRRAAATARTRVPGGPALVESAEREFLAGSGLLAGGVAYRLFLWLLPFGLVLAAIGSFWSEADPDGIQDTAEHFGFPVTVARSARTGFETGSHGRWYLLVTGIVLLLWFGASAVRSLRIAHALAWAVPTTRLRRPLHASVLFTGVIVGALALGLAARWLRHTAGAGAELPALLVLLVVYVAAATGVMLLLPHGEAPWTALLPGAAVVAIGIQLMHVLVVLYLAPKLEHSTKLYGSLGAATVILLWLYLIARLLVSAAFLNATLWDRKRAARG